MNQISITVPNEPAILKATADYFKCLHEILAPKSAAVAEKVIESRDNPFANPAVKVPPPEVMTLADDLGCAIADAAITADADMSETCPPLPPPPVFTISNNNTGASIEKGAVVNITLPPAGVQLDSEGLPWDARIHSESKALLVKGNTWKLRRGVDPALVDSVKAELRQAMSAGTASPAPVVDLPPPAGALPPPAGALPPPAGALPPPAGAVTSFPQFMQKVTASKIDVAKVLASVNKFGIASVQLLAVRPDLIPQVDADLFGGN